LPKKVGERFLSSKSSQRRTRTHYLMTMIYLRAKGNLHLSMMNRQRRRRSRSLYKYLVFLKSQKVMPLHQSLKSLIKISLLRPPQMRTKSRCRMSRNQYLKR
jgi:hypothetical protein